jgi:hypothetical protein
VLATEHPSSENVGTNFPDKRRSRSRYSSLAGWRPWSFFICIWGLLFCRYVLLIKFVVIMNRTSPWQRTLDILYLSYLAVGSMTEFGVFKNIDRKLCRECHGITWIFLYIEYFSTYAVTEFVCLFIKWNMSCFAVDEECFFIDVLSSD